MHRQRIKVILCMATHNLNLTLEGSFAAWKFFAPPLDPPTPGLDLGGVPLHIITFEKDSRLKLKRDQKWFNHNQPLNPVDTMGGWVSCSSRMKMFFHFVLKVIVWGVFSIQSF
jgi:hypothetical protein